MTHVKSAWGDERTHFFFSLTPDRVLAAAETAALSCTGRCFSLNSFENRVYDLEIEEDPKPRRVVAKFYRPGRWSEKQILEEHEFIADLAAAEIPTAAPIQFKDGRTLHPSGEGESAIYYALFPKIGGRAPDELNDDQLRRVGRLLGRLHNIGATKEATQRIRIGADTYGLSNLEYLLHSECIPLDFIERYRTAAHGICHLSVSLFKDVRFQRIHGDCHLGNLLWNPDGPFFVDFDDMLVGPAVQDIWLLVPGRDPESLRQREVLLEGYREMREFHDFELLLVEPLRALRLIHYSAWLARRWEDPAFPRAFPEFGSYRYWSEETGDLERQLALMQGDRSRGNQI